MTKTEFLAHLNLLFIRMKNHSNDYIPKNEYFDMPSLFEKLIQEKKNTITFPIKEYWCDIGRIEEFKKANEDYKRIFGE